MGSLGAFGAEKRGTLPHWCGVSGHFLARARAYIYKVRCEGLEHISDAIWLPKAVGMAPSYSPKGGNVHFHAHRGLRALMRVIL